MLAAPLIAGNDLASMSKETLEILTNQEAIAVDQDSLGIQAFSYAMNDKVEIWFKPLRNDERAVCFLNRNVETKPVEFTWSEHKVTDSFANREADFTKTTYKIRDLWAKKDIGKTGKKLSVTVPGHDVLMLRLTPVK